MPKKFTYDEIKHYIEIESDNGYKLLSKEYKGVDSPLKIETFDGYLSMTKVSALRNGREISIFDKSNPFTLENIKLWMTKNNKNFQLVSEEYIGTDTRLVFITLEGYLFTQTWHHLHDGHGYYIFQKKNIYTIYNINLWLKNNNKEFELLSEEYIDANKKLKWKCLKGNCGEEFEMDWASAFQNYGCPYCAGRQVGLSNSLITLNSEIAKQWHPTMNNDLTPYDVTCGSDKKVWWKCNICDSEWETQIKQRTKDDGTNCPVCNNSSKANDRIIKFCKINDIAYLPEYKINECKDIRPLPFDVGIKHNNDLFCLIEADGLQHYEPVCFGGISYERALDNLKIAQHHDEIKNKYCEDNNIRLIRIPYWEFNNIEEILKDELLM